MTVSTLRPDGTTATGGTPTLTGGATAHAVLSDDSDSTYATYDLAESNTLSWGDFTLPAGAVVKSVAVRARGHIVSGTGATASLQTTVTGLPTSPVAGFTAITWTVPTTFTVATLVQSGVAESHVDGMTALFGVVSGADVRLIEAYVDVTHVARPVVAVDAVTDPLTTTNRPAFTWVDTLDSDGGAQTMFEVRVFTDAQYGAGGFDPATSTATVESGQTAGADLTYQVADALADDTYRAYVRVAQTVNGALHWSDWDFDEFTVTVALPGTPTVVVTADAASGRNTIAITNVAGTASTDGFEVQRSLDAETTWESVRTADGDGLLDVPYVVATGVLADSADTTSHVVPLPAPPDGILADDLLIAVAGMDGNPTFTWPTGWTELVDVAGNGSAVRAGVAYYRAVGGETGTVTVTTSASEGGGIRILCVRGAHASTAPEVGTSVNAATANADPGSVNPSGWDVEPTLWIAAMVNDGNVAVTAAPSGYFNFGNTRWANASGAGVATATKLSFAASEDPGAFTNSAEDSRAFGIAVRPRNADLTVHDYEAPNGVEVSYRARARHDYSGEFAVGAWGTDSGTWSSEDWWLKHPILPALNRLVKVRSFRAKGREHRVGVFQALGATFPITIADTRGGLSGSITLRMDSVADQDGLDALLATCDVLLLQSPSGGGGPDYIAVKSHEQERAIDNTPAFPSFDTIEWMQVDAVPSSAHLYPDDGLFPA